MIKYIFNGYNLSVLAILFIVYANYQMTYSEESKILNQDENYKPTNNYDHDQDWEDSDKWHTIWYNQIDTNSNGEDDALEYHGKEGTSEYGEYEQTINN